MKEAVESITTLDTTVVETQQKPTIELVTLMNNQITLECEPKDPMCSPCKPRCTPTCSPTSSGQCGPRPWPW